HCILTLSMCHFYLLHPQRNKAVPPIGYLRALLLFPINQAHLGAVRALGGRIGCVPTGRTLQRWRRTPSSDVTPGGTPRPWFALVCINSILFDLYQRQHA